MSNMTSKLSRQEEFFYYYYALCFEGEESCVLSRQWRNIHILQFISNVLPTNHHCAISTVVKYNAKSTSRFQTSQTQLGPTRSSPPSPTNLRDLREPWPPYQGGGDIMHSLREARVKNDYSIQIAIFIKIL